jgi:hypothetical protein
VQSFLQEIAEVGDVSSNIGQGRFDRGHAVTFHDEIFRPFRIAAASNVESLGETGGLVHCVCAEARYEDV